MSVGRCEDVTDPRPLPPVCSMMFAVCVTGPAEADQATQAQPRQAAPICPQVTRAPPRGLRIGARAPRRLTGSEAPGRKVRVRPSPVHYDIYINDIYTTTAIVVLFYRMKKINADRCFYSIIIILVIGICAVKRKTEVRSATGRIDTASPGTGHRGRGSA